MSAPDPHGAAGFRRATRRGPHVVVACAALAMAVGACRSPTPTAGPGAVELGGAAPQPAAPARPPQPPGAGVLAGRLVDAGSGLPVAGAEVRLHGYGRRVRSATDGSFRFEGVEAGRVSLRVLPGPRFVPRAVETMVSDDGSNTGLIRLQAAAEPSWISREYGGLARGCGPTQLAVASDSVAELAEVRATCLSDPALLPAPPPRDQLLLSALHLAPDGLELERPAALTLALPAEPRFGAGSELDMLRLDLDTLRWTGVGQASVAPGGNSATGEVDGLGTYALAVAPMGATSRRSVGPGIGTLHVAATPGGPAEERFEPGVPLVYLGLEYVGMDNSRVRVTTLDSDGEVAFQSDRPYVGAGRDDVPMAVDGGWPAGEYVTEVAVDGEPLAEVPWFVEPAPAAALPPAAPGYYLPAPRVPQCRPPAGWYPHLVRAGDTLSALAAQLGTSVGVLRQANCLGSDAIFVGQILYLPAPSPPLDLKPAWPVRPTPWYVTPWPPADQPATEPPPISGPPPGAPVPWPTPGPKPGDPTLAPRPTAPPLPTEA